MSELRVTEATFVIEAAVDGERVGSFIKIAPKLVFDGWVTEESILRQAWKELGSKWEEGASEPRVTEATFVVKTTVDGEKVGSLFRIAPKYVFDGTLTEEFLLRQGQKQLDKYMERKED